ncbi:hypothetical protein V6N11_071847 [Hibiscus sabdariffa]|uniref:Uncharacterized protein n=1 Tax=Hibiscus sabdariffa TaxID=183260 RepID=A0ABR2U234_9ROSI
MVDVEFSTPSLPIHTIEKPSHTLDPHVSNPNSVLTSTNTYDINDVPKNSSNPSPCINMGNEMMKPWRASRFPLLPPMAEDNDIYLLEGDVTCDSVNGIISIDFSDRVQALAEENFDQTVWNAGNDAQLPNILQVLANPTAQGSRFNPLFEASDDDMAMTSVIPTEAQNLLARNGKVPIHQPSKSPKQWPPVSLRKPLKVSMLSSSSNPLPPPLPRKSKELPHNTTRTSRDSHKAVLIPEESAPIALPNHHEH